MRTKRKHTLKRYKTRRTSKCRKHNIRRKTYRKRCRMRGG